MGRYLQREPDAVERLLVPCGIYGGRGIQTVQGALYPKEVETPDIVQAKGPRNVAGPFAFVDIDGGSTKASGTMGPQTGFGTALRHHHWIQDLRW